jgi:hypothetical protein
VPLSTLRISPLPAFAAGALPVPALELEPAALLPLPPASMNPRPTGLLLEEQANEAKRRGESPDQSREVRIMAYGNVGHSDFDHSA